ncbi:RloB family protein [Tumebacillus permanentifrigoris]|uniref:RloB-like protein n=1 Tax=Tumebacillus permanentifrigoris TaxID=378543 RepID=A0A316DFH7_9BACL|nr:RloB family protein [Tumebacillus permanentifrigoris]PWK16348.1 RloB-like protein [Tumebacillus permanentifrigoris]
MSRSRSRERRTVGSKETRDTILIVCEAKNQTERIYFRNFATTEKSGVRVQVAEEHKYSVPADLVDYAQKLAVDTFKLDLQDGDQVWCVLDVDAQQNSGPRDEQLRTLRDRANRRGVSLAISNPSFEIWFLAHFEYSTRNYTNRELLDKLNSREELGGYQKTKCVFSKIVNLQSTAVRNALRLDQHHRDLGRNLDLSESNPSTQVYKLIEQIDAVARKNSTR